MSDVKCNILWMIYIHWACGILHVAPSEWACTHQVHHSNRSFPALPGHRHITSHHSHSPSAHKWSQILKPGFHYPSWRHELTGDRFPLPVNTGRVDGRVFPLAKLTGCQHGPSTWLVETRARQHGVTGHPSTRAVNSGSGNQALLISSQSVLLLINVKNLTV